MVKDVLSLQVIKEMTDDASVLFVICGQPREMGALQSMKIQYSRTNI